MTPLRTKMIRELELQRKSKNTIKAYITAVKELALYFNRSPEQISRQEIRDYAHYLITEKKLANASVNEVLTHRFHQLSRRCFGKTRKLALIGDLSPV